MSSFVVSEITQKLLKNFSGISNSVLLSPGKTQKTVLQSKGVFAIAEFPEAWPKETGIYDLGMFLSTLSQFAKPSLDFKDDAMIVSDTPKGALSVRYRYSDPSTIMEIGDKKFPTDNPSVEFMLSEHALSQVKKTASLLKLTGVNIIVSKDEGVTLTAHEPKNQTAHTFKLDIPKSEVTFHDKKFERTAPFKVEHLSYLLDGSYKVALAGWKYAYLTHQSLPLSYYVVQNV